MKPALRAAVASCPLFLGVATALTPASRGQDLAAELAAAVDLPTPAKRRAAALRLAARKEISLAAWKDAMRSFGTFERSRAGVRIDKVPLLIDRTVEQTEIVTYIPPAYDPAKPAPLMVMFHGTGGSGRGQQHWWEDVADELGMLVLCPSEAGPNKGYGFTPRERTAALAALRWMRRNFNVDENRIYLTGISRGGHMCWDLALRHPDLFAAIAPMIGGPRLNTARGQNNLRYLANIAHLPIRDLQGSKDDPRLLFNLHLAFAELEQLGARDARLIEFPDLGHSFEMEAVDWKEFLAGCLRNPLPVRVVRSYARRGEGRAFWLEIHSAGKEVKEDFRPRIEARSWKQMDDAARRRFIEKEAENHTARLEVHRAAPDLYAARGRHVRSFALLLAEGLYPPAKPLRVTFDGKSYKRRIHPSKRVLLLEFVERFDRRFLPEVSVSIPR